MLYLFWALLNIGLFIFVCFKGSQYFREKLGRIASIVFLLALFAFIGNSTNDNDNKENNSSRIKTWEFYPLDSLSKSSNQFIDIDLERTLISKYRLGIGYGKDKLLKNNIPTSATTWTTGFISGTTWKPINIIINRTEDNNKFEYVVDGTIKWSLVGLTIYSQLKSWKGVAILK